MNKVISPFVFQLLDSIPSQMAVYADFDQDSEFQVKDLKC